MHMNQKAVMIIPGGKFQVPLVKKAKQMGLFVVVTDADDSAPCREFADVFLTASAYDCATNLEIAKRFDVSAVLTDQTDTAVKTVAYLNEQLNLCGIGTDKADLFTNKLRMMQFCRDHGFPHPKFELCYTLDDALRFAERELKYPIIIKPIDSQSSKGVFLINSIEELEEKFNISRSHSVSEKVVLVEEYIDGDEFTVDGIKIREQNLVLAVSKKTKYEQNSMVAKSLLFSHVDRLYNYSKLRSQHASLVASMGLSFGLTHAEYKFSKGEFYLIEIAARGGGTEISSIITREMSGIDSYEHLLHAALGNTDNLVMDKPQSTVMLLEFLDLPSGTVKSIRGLEQIETLPYVTKISLNIDVNYTIQPVSNDVDRAGYYILMADSENSLIIQKQELLNMLVVEYE